MPREGSLGSLLLFLEQRRRRGGASAELPQGKEDAAASLGVFRQIRLRGTVVAVGSASSSGQL